jgi:hypothetical protein
VVTSGELGMGESSTCSSMPLFSAGSVAYVGASHAQPSPPFTDSDPCFDRLRLCRPPSCFSMLTPMMKHC